MRHMLALMVAAAALLGIGGHEALAQGAPPRFLLNGVVIDAKGKAIAWLQEPAITQNKSVSGLVGDTFGPYRITKIEEDRVELQGPTGPVVVRLYTTAVSGTTPAVTPPVPPAQTVPVTPATSAAPGAASRESVGAAAPPVADAQAREDIARERTMRRVPPTTGPAGVSPSPQEASPAPPRSAGPTAPAQGQPRSRGLGALFGGGS